MSGRFAVACRVLNIAQQPYDRWVERPASFRDRIDAFLANAAFDRHHDLPGLEKRVIAEDSEDAGFKILRPRGTAGAVMADGHLSHPLQALREARQGQSAVAREPGNTPSSA